VPGFDLFAVTIDRGGAFFVIGACQTRLGMESRRSRNGAQ
jgi:hypothetical protein